MDDLIDQNKIHFNFKNCFYLTDANCLHKIVDGVVFPIHYRNGGYIYLENGQTIEQGPIDVIFKRIHWNEMFDGADNEDIDYDKYIKMYERQFYDKQYYAIDTITKGGKQYKSKKLNKTSRKRSVSLRKLIHN